MNSNTTCAKVTALMSLYIDNKLEEPMLSFVKEHIQICESCYKKYLTLSKLLTDLKKIYTSLETKMPVKEKVSVFNIKEYEDFRENLSAYLDNELPIEKSVDMKKYMIKYPNARYELEKIYKLQQNMQTSINNLKKGIHYNYTKPILYKLGGNKIINNKAKLIAKLIFYTFLLCTLLITIISLWIK